MNSIYQTFSLRRTLKPLVACVAAALLAAGCATQSSSSSGGSSGGGASGGGVMVGGGMSGAGGMCSGGGPGGGGVSGDGMPGGDGSGGDGSGGGIRGLGGQMPGTGSQNEGSGGVGEYPGESDAERRARKEKELEKQVGGFDEVLAEEQEEISTVGRNTEGFGGERRKGGGVDLGKQASGGIEGSGEDADAEGGGAGSSPSVAGLSEEDIKQRTPADIPDLVSEDIVAKQLREAALAGEDPVLRERLWEEYRNYNNL
jgi:hypothetical protein